MSAFVIVGAGQAGGTAATVLREEGFDGNVILIGAEGRPPYERPPLSKQYLRGELDFEHTLVRPTDFYVEQRVQTLFGARATRLDPAARIVELAGGEHIPYDRVLIATGGRPRRLAVPGRDLEGVYDLRTVDDADRIRAEAAPGRRAVVVGMGFIGSEVAASLRCRGVDVVTVAPSRLPLVHVLGEDIGRVIESLHRDHGVEMIVEDTVAAFEGGERVERVMTTTGRRLECDFVVVGVGIEPVTGFLAGSGVQVDNGIVVDEYCRTNVEGIYAAGDIANHYHPVIGRHIRVEHWQNALKQGAAAARSMLGQNTLYDDVPWFWSDQYDVNLQYAGFHSAWDELVVRGRLEERDCIAFYLKEGQVMAALAVNRGKELRRAMSLIKARARIDPAMLRDEDTDLRKLVSTVDEHRQDSAGKSD
jgi:3-phenylpropionate/trans-cinnamate dioxygenase ferredoxin reductase subunit